MNRSASLATRPADSPPLRSRATVALTGLSCLFVAFGFSFLDRRFGTFGLECSLWLLWLAVGFGAGTRNVHKPANAGQTQWLVLGSLGALLALFPGFAMFSLLRWMALALMIVIGARAAVLKTRRDFYLTLMVFFVVSLLVGTHANADWSVWFYLGPAWVFGGLALAWDHAAGTALSRWTKLFMTLGFISTALLLALALFFFAPRPPILGFGFLPPGTDTPGLFQASGSSNTAPGSGNHQQPGDAGTGQYAAGSWQPSDRGQQWDTMLKSMRRSALDPTIPQWQRSIIEKAIDWAQIIRQLWHRQAAESADQAAQSQARPEEPEPDQPPPLRLNWLLLLALLLAAYLLWRSRHRLGLQLALTGAWLLTRRYPAPSMRCSAQAMKYGLHLLGHKQRPGQSVREHWVAAAGMAPLAKRWLGQALECYCAMRFGNMPATPQQAIAMHEAVLGACEIMLGKAPELTR